MTFVDRTTRCILAWMVIHKLSGYEFQEMLANSVPGHDYYSDDFEAYKTVLYWPPIHHSMKDNSQTYSVEGSYAGFRHYLARLRRRSRCFSRKKEALHNAVKIFVYAYNHSQLYKQLYPHYNPSLLSFISA